MPDIFDIAIIGGGIVGASVAQAVCGQRSVLLLELEDAFGYHATGRSAAEFSLRFHSPAVGALTRASRTFLETPPDGFAEVPLLRPRGNLLIAHADKAEMLHQSFKAEMVTSQGAPDLQLLSPAEACQMVPFLDPDWVAAAFHDPACQDIEVDALLQGYLRSARRAGACLHRSATLLAARREIDHWILETAAGDFRARAVVNAAGAWADGVAAKFGAGPLGLVPHRRTAISVKVPDHDLSTLPEVSEIEEEFYFKPDAGQLMVSPADETPVEPHDAWPEEIDIAFAAHHLGECTLLQVDHIAHSWAGLRTLSPDRLPVIGPSSHVPGLFWVAGLGGFGIQTSAAVGQLAAAMLLDTAVPDTLEAEGLGPGSFPAARFGG